MNFKEYLDRLLGEKEAKKLRSALKRNCVIEISGPIRPSTTGKSTLVNVLRKRRYNAYETESGVHRVYLSKPLETIIPKFSESIV